MNRKIVVTDDGSHTLFVKGMNEHYHSTHGAINESEHVYIESGLRPAIQGKEKLAVLEIGFGTGLNALLTLKEAIKTKTRIHYVTLEPYPLEAAIYKKLNYDEIINISKLTNPLAKLHGLPWGMPNFVSDFFIINKINALLEEVELSEDAFDVVFYDAFAPGKQPEVWSRENFAKCYTALKPEGLLVTYSSQGQVKRNLKSVGFEIEKLPGPEGKREILSAKKK